MIHILFLSGAFGSTVQFLLRTYGDQYKDLKLSGKVPYHLNGSMHGYVKTGHYGTMHQLDAFLEGRLDRDIKISTPNYPLIDATAKTVINKLKTARPDDPVVFLYVSDIRYAEINMIARFYKVSYNDPIESVRMMVGDDYKNIQNWNKEYQHWTDMQVWELREWLSLFYPIWIDEWISSLACIDKKWLAISTQEIFDDTENTFTKILSYAGKYTLDDNFVKFCQEWRDKQQYLLDAYIQIECIVDCTINNVEFEWHPLGFIEEVIVQKKIRDSGYELKCFDLNVFPTTSTELYKLLKK